MRQELIKNNIDILFGNKEEVCAMVQSSALQDAITYAKSLNIICVITLAEKGSLIIHKEEVFEINAVKVDKVVDTTGAGDAFNAGFAVALTEDKNIKDSIEFANITAGLSTTKIGTAKSMPFRSEIDNLL